MNINKGNKPHAVSDTKGEYLQQTLVKYYEGMLSIDEKIRNYQPAKNYVVGLDWLQIMMLSPLNLESTAFGTGKPTDSKSSQIGEFMGTDSEPTEAGVYEQKNKLFGTVRMEIEGIGTSIYAKRCIIHIKPKGQRKFTKFGTGLFQPYKGLHNLKDNFFQLQVDNHLLYANWYELYKIFVGVTGFSFAHFVRVDIALDSKETMLKEAAAMVKVAQMSNAPSVLHHAGKCKLGYMDTGKGAKYQLGAGSSDKKLIIYNKTAEIIKSSAKKYISDFHAANLENDGRDVWRCELRLMQKYIQKLPTLEMVGQGGISQKLCSEPVTVAQLTDSEFLKQIWNFCTVSLIDFRYMPNGSSIKNVAYWDKLTFFDFSPKERARVLDTAEAPTDVTFKPKLIIKHYVAELYTRKISKHDERARFRVIKDYLQRFSLHRWYKDALPRWRVDLDKLLHITGSQPRMNWERITELEQVVPAFNL